MILCPNHTRTKRVHPGGGNPGCRGRLQVRMNVALAFPAKSWPRLVSPLADFQDAVKGYVREHGHRVSGRELLECFNRGDWDLFCPTCGFSLKAGLKALNKASKRARSR